MLLKEMLEEYQNDVAYNLPFGEVTLTGARQVYFEIRAKYVNLAARARDDFTKEYETYESTREMVSRTYLKFYTIWDDIVEEACKDLVSIGYYELDESTLYKISVKRGCTRFFDDAYQEIKDEVSDIKEELTNRENYREEHLRELHEGAQIRQISSAQKRGCLRMTKCHPGQPHFLFFSARAR